MKNSMIELERFMASIFVLLYHLGAVKAGWIFVEFFFILMGYFLTKHLEKHKDEEKMASIWYPLNYTLKKYFNLLPYAGISILVMCFLYVGVWNLSGSDLIKWLLYLPCELLLVGGTGIQPYGYVFSGSIVVPRMMNSILWYLACMLIVMPIVIYLLLNQKKARALLCTVVPALLYGFLIMRDGSVNGWHDEKFAFVYCNIRAMAGILLGTGVWHLSEWWKKNKYTKLGKITLTLTEVLSFIVVAIVSSTTDAPYDSLEIGLFALSISLTTSGVTYTANINNKLFRVVGSWSLAIYCLHMPIMLGCAGRFAEYNTLVTVVIVIIISAVYTALVKWGQKWYKLHKERMGHFLVEQ